MLRMKILARCCSLLLAVLLLAGGLPAAAQPPDPADQITGQWQMAPNKRAKSGSITFKANGTYVMDERLQDGDRVGKKGQYILYPTAAPTRIDICLMKCGGPGSQYTTSFGIYRFLPDGRLEIRTSPDGKYPTAFNDGADPLQDAYTMFLTRVP